MKIRECILAVISTFVIFHNAEAQLVKGDQIFEVSFGSYTGELVQEQTDAYYIALAKDEAIVATLDVSNPSSLQCYDNIEFILLDSIGTKVDSSIIYSSSAGTTNRMGTSFKSNVAGLHKLFITRTNGYKECNNISFPYSLGLSSYTGHIDPVRKIEAVTGVYKDGLAYADIHNYSFILPKNKIFKALINLNTAIDRTCYHNVDLNLFNSLGSLVATNGESFIAKETDVSTVDLEYKSESSGRYNLQVIREPTAYGVECDTAVFPYDLHLTLPSGLACLKKEVNNFCKPQCQDKCKRSGNKKACKKVCMNKCVAKGKC